METPQVVLDLVDRFECNRDVYCSNQYNETQTRHEFIDPFFMTLGWDVNNEKGYAEAYKGLSAKTDHEKSLIQRQIKETDRQIDQLVYELYGLSEEEIKIVEEKNREVTSQEPTSPSKRNPSAERYRLYIDESGDHVFRELTNESHRFLCLLGSWFRGADYVDFQRELELFKQEHIPHNPDDPVILHREEIINCRGPFWRLRNAERRQAFDDALIELIRNASFTVVAVVIDKKILQEKYPTPAHPYHLAIGFLLQRYCGYLNHINRHGDVMAESRGARENRLLMDSYERHYEHGAWHMEAEEFQRALTTRKLKIKQKSANIAGLQLADILVNPLRKAVLIESKAVEASLRPFAKRIVKVTQTKLNHHLYKGYVEGYGKVLFPK